MIYPNYKNIANCLPFQQTDQVVTDRVPQGCGTRAYMDVFTACLERPDRSAERAGLDIKVSI